MSCSHSTLNYLALSCVKGIGPATLRKIHAAFGSEVALKDPDALQPCLPSNITLSPGAIDEAMDRAQFQIDQAQAHSAVILSRADPDYPPLLASSHDDPFILYVKGSLAAPETLSVAIVGTRKPTRHGSVIAHRIAGYCSEQGASIVSGLALGCDAIAHQSVIDHRGHTVAVLAHGLQTVAPQDNRPLAEAILERGGALVSQFPFGTDPIPANFVKRDRVQAGLAQGVILVQSGMSGGSLHASRAALRSGRFLAVVRPTDADLESNIHSIRANRCLTDPETPTDEKAQLLKCDPDRLTAMRVINGRDDYPRLFA
ncbi:DNA-processing protein DprA [Marinobacterium sp. BA1]|uniref:DNA-processing protein DprA n=1 Tax=Marinobacterium sp. BA1 TaxID=3138931 RepID=UPI0032E7D9AD